MGSAGEGNVMTSGWQLKHGHGVTHAVPGRIQSILGLLRVSQSVSLGHHECLP